MSTWSEKLEALRADNNTLRAENILTHVRELLGSVQAEILMQESWRDPLINSGINPEDETLFYVLLEWWDDKPQGETLHKVTVDVFEDHFDVMEIDFSDALQGWPEHTFPRGKVRPLRDALGRLWGVCLRPAEMNEEAAAVVAALRATYPEADVRDDGPTQGGHHFIDVKLGDKFLVLQIEPNKPRGGSVLTDDPFEGLFETNADFVFPTREKLLAWVREQLTS